MADTVPEAEFEKAALAFLEANAEPRVEVEQAWGEGSDQVSLLPERTPEEEHAELEAARAWAQRRFDAGFGWITGPVEYGGGASPATTSGSTTPSRPGTTRRP